jgi:hypothetical protein
LKCPKIRGVGPPEVSRIMNTRFVLKIDSYGVMGLKPFDARLVALNVAMTQIIYPI